jgi:hypothetical protein
MTVVSVTVFGLACQGVSPWEREPRKARSGESSRMARQQNAVPLCGKVILRPVEWPTVWCVSENGRE